MTAPVAIRHYREPVLGAAVNLLVMHGGTVEGGSTNVTALDEYAQPMHARRLVFRYTRDYDAMLATGQIAGGATLICLTTGRDSAYC